MPYPFVLSEAAQQDVRELLRWSRERFGLLAAQRYRALLMQVLRDVADDPQRIGSRERPELLVAGARTYHFFFSSDHVAGERVRNPRHFVLYRVRDATTVEIARILHDSRELSRHLPGGYRA